MNDSHGADRAAERANEAGGAPRPASSADRTSRERTEGAKSQTAASSAPRRSSVDTGSSRPRGDRTVPRRPSPSSPSNPPASRRSGPRADGSLAPTQHGSQSSSGSPSAPLLRRSPGTVAGPSGSSVRSAMAVTRGAAAQSLASITAQLDAGQMFASEPDANPTVRRSPHPAEAGNARGHLRLVPPIAEPEAAEPGTPRSTLEVSGDHLTGATGDTRQLTRSMAAKANARLGQPTLDNSESSQGGTSGLAATTTTSIGIGRHRAGRIPRSLAPPVLAGRRPGDGRRVVVALAGKLLRREIKQSAAPAFPPSTAWPGDTLQVTTPLRRSPSLDGMPTFPTASATFGSARIAPETSVAGRSPQRSRSTSTATVIGEAVRSSATVLAGPNSLVAARRASNEVRRHRSATNRPVARAVAEATVAASQSLGGSTLLRAVPERSEVNSDGLSLGERVARAFRNAGPVGSEPTAVPMDAPSQETSRFNLTPSGPSVSSEDTSEVLPGPRPSTGRAITLPLRPTAHLPTALRPVVGRQLVARRRAAPVDARPATAESPRHRAEPPVTRLGMPSDLSVSRRPARRAAPVDARPATAESPRHRAEPPVTRLGMPSDLSVSRRPARRATVTSQRPPTTSPVAQREASAPPATRSATGRAVASGSHPTTAQTSMVRGLGHGVILRSRSAPEAARSSTTAERDAGSRATFGASSTTPLAGRLLRRSAETTGAGDSETAALAGAQPDEIVRDRSRPLAERVAALASNPIDSHGSTSGGTLERQEGPVVGGQTVMGSPADVPVSVQARSVAGPAGRRASGMTGIRSATLASVAPLPDVRPSATATGTSPVTPSTTVTRSTSGRRDLSSSPTVSRAADPLSASVRRADDSRESVADIADASSDAPAVARSTRGRPRPRRVVRSRTAIARRDTVRRSTSETVRRDSAPITVEPADRRQSSTERLDQIEELMAALEERILRSLERRGGVQRGWF